MISLIMHSAFYIYPPSVGNPLQRSSRVCHAMQATEHLRLLYHRHVQPMPRPQVLFCVAPVHRLANLAHASNSVYARHVSTFLPARLHSRVPSGSAGENLARPFLSLSSSK